MHNQIISSALALILVATTCLTSSGCRGGFRGMASCGCADETYDSPCCGCADETCDSPCCGCADETCDSPCCGCADETCDSPCCGCADETYDSPSCGCADETCDSVDCGSEIECGQGQCGWLKKLFGGFKLCGCAGCDGELYWSEWYNEPPGPEPCDSCGNWIGPRGVYRAPYRTLPGMVTEPYGNLEDEAAASYSFPEEETTQNNLLEKDYTAKSYLNDAPIDPQDDFTFEEEQAEEKSFELVLERETIFR